MCCVHNCVEAWKVASLLDWSGGGAVAFFRSGCVNTAGKGVGVVSAEVCVQGLSLGTYHHGPFTRPARVHA